MSTPYKRKLYKKMMNELNNSDSDVQPVPPLPIIPEEQLLPVMEEIEQIESIAEVEAIPKPVIDKEKLKKQAETIAKNTDRLEKTLSGLSKHTAKHSGKK